MHCLHGCLRCIVLSHAQLVTDIPFWFPFFLFFFRVCVRRGGGRCNITSVFPRYTGNEGVFFFLVSGNGNQTRCTCDVDRGICGVAETNHSTTSPAILTRTKGSEFILDTVEALGLTDESFFVSPLPDWAFGKVDIWELGVFVQLARKNSESEMEPFLSVCCLGQG